MRLPQDISAGARSRRALLADTLIALGLTALAILLAAGIGVVGFVALLTVVILVAWIGAEAAVRRVWRRSGDWRRSPPEVRRGSDRTAAGDGAAPRS